MEAVVVRASTSEDATAMKLALPPMPPSVSVLKYSAHPGRPPSLVYLLGTAHVSAESAEEARRLVMQVQPDAVFLELCQARTALLTIDKMEVPTLNDMYVQLVHHKARLWGVLYGWALASIAEKLDVVPGEEFRAAFAAAKETGAKVLLGDRPIKATLERTWAALSVKEKLYLLKDFMEMGCLPTDAKELAEAIEAMKDADMITELIKEYADHCPSLLEPLVYERDRFMVHSLRQAAAQFPVVVAVVGAGHCPGIRENWEAEIDVEELMEIPDTSNQPSLLLAAAYEWRWHIAVSVTIVAGATCGAAVLCSRLCRRLRV